MSRERHDSLAKGFLSDWLELIGATEPDRAIASEERGIDLVVHARRRMRRWRTTFVLLERMAKGWAGFEVFRNPVSMRELRASAGKGIDLEAELLRRARRRHQRRSQVVQPVIWVITPTASPELRGTFGLVPMLDWPAGFFGSAQGWGVGVVVVHELPVLGSTLFLRLMGRGEVQTQAFEEVTRLPNRHPMRRPTVERVLRFRKAAMVRSRLSQEQREFLMNTDTLDEWERENRADAAAHAILTALDARGMKVSATVKKRLKACTDLKRLDRLMRRAVVVERASQLFD